MQTSSAYTFSLLISVVAHFVGNCSVTVTDQVCNIGRLKSKKDIYFEVKTTDIIQYKVIMNIVAYRHRPERQKYELKNKMNCAP
jgi:hypothetical protein